MTIFSTNDSQARILRDIAVLHNNGEPFSADLTYGHGGFWKHEAADFRPAIRADIDDRLPGLTHPGISVRLLQGAFAPCSLGSVVIDLPFMHAHGAESIMGKRFNSIKSQEALNSLHRLTSYETYDVLSAHGLLVWKCQDIVESGKQVWNHIKIHEHCLNVGFTMIDLFVLIRKTALRGHNHARQQHSRRLHSYFLVFRK